MSLDATPSSSMGALIVMPVSRAFPPPSQKFVATTLEEGNTKEADEPAEDNLPASNLGMRVWTSSYPPTYGLGMGVAGQPERLCYVWGNLLGGFFLSGQRPNRPSWRLGWI